MNKNKFFAVIFAILALSLIVFIFSNSLKTAEVSSEQSGGIVDSVVEFLNDIGIKANSDDMSFIIRKLAHFAEYFLLGGLVYLSTLFFGAKNPAVFAISVCLITAVGDEFIAQRITEGRSPEVRDCIIDILGGATSSAIIYFITRKRYSDM
jgi:VanZ family protein